MGPVPWIVEPAYLILAAALLVGLWLYERYDWRLGGVLVLPLVVFYALVEPLAIAVFFGAAILAYVGGEVLRARTMLYGRRMMYAHLLIGLLASGLLATGLGVIDGGLVLAVLPGVFAYHMHREGRPVTELGRFAAVLALALVVVHVVLFPFDVEVGLFQYGWFGGDAAPVASAGSARTISEALGIGGGVLYAADDGGGE